MEHDKDERNTNAADAHGGNIASTLDETSIAKKAPPLGSGLFFRWNPAGPRSETLRAHIRVRPGLKCAAHNRSANVLAAAKQWY